MPRFPSKTILVKDVIGEARELIAVEDARLQLKSLGRVFYNMAISEIHIILGYVDEESLLDTAILNPITNYGRYYYTNMAGIPTLDKYDKVKSVWAECSSGIITGYPVSLTEFNTHRANSSAKFPYNESFVYTEIGTMINIVFGADVNLDSMQISVQYKRQPNFVTSDNYNIEYIDLPDKYYPLLVNRIASLAEIRNGISDKSLTFVKQTYDQLLASVDPTIKAKIMGSLTYKSTTLGDNV